MSEILFTLTLIFTAAATALLISRELDQPAVPLYILSGLFLTNFMELNQVLDLSRVGIAFLVFIYGVKFSTRKLQSVARNGGLAAVVSIVMTTTLALPTALLLQLRGIEIAVFVSASALSSSLVGLELISDDLRKELVHSRLIETVQLLQDLAAVILILLIFSVTPLHAVTYGLVLLILSYSFKKGFTVFAKSFKDSTETIMVFSLGTLAGFVGISYILEIPTVVGAFAAGLALSKYPYSLEIIDTVGTLKDFFTAILFVSIGAIAATADTQVFITAAAITAFTLVVNPFVIYTALRTVEENSRVAFLTGLGLDQVSEFAVIIAIQAYLLELIQIGLLQSVVVATAATMTLSAYTSRNQQKLYKIFSNLFATPDGMESTVDEPENHIILIGYDVQGKKIVEGLEEKPVVIEYDPEKIDGLKERNIDYVFGDVMHQKPWEEANYKEADLIVSTVPLRHVSDKIIGLDTEADKILRSPDAEQAHQLMEEGATFVSVPKHLAAQRLTEHIKGIFNSPEYRHELRRKNMLQLRKELREE
ncbi:cation:proton antiporter [Candidatus Nanohalobium constans]|uniref:Kef-type K+ transport system, membrane component KefB n=1 Tax=Candidatus Nanohalobium constans TaxID=2565781 RepID=A0A5Q0UIA0_9ARCH|nr:cation:proton antiporter [Candidatus Nanohalobium constans]QGA80655.1 Kef-type K+ transport system, membrane component KefB [Candidatus Nanohalobium constans]